MLDSDVDNLIRQDVHLLINRALLEITACHTPMLPLHFAHGLIALKLSHTDVVARAADQELSVTRLAGLMGNSKAPLRKDVAIAITDAVILGSPARQPRRERDER